LIKNGDKISINVREGTLNILISDEELEARRKLWVAPKPVADRGYVSMYIKEVQQADKGADFGYLIGSSGRGIPRESH
jgi:dihydroxy-acid dehydratase